MKEQYQQLLKRPLEAILHFSDVFSGPEVDFDAELTATFRNLGVLSDRPYFVGGNVHLAGYGAVLINDLSLERKRIAEKLNVPFAHKEDALCVILNTLPREGYRVEDAPNGRDFHLAITDQGVEIFAVPLATLSALESRNAIVALYRIPNAQIPLTDGMHEQFRSSIIALSRYQPEIFETVFEYETVEDMIRAKLYGMHPDVIPVQENEVEFAYSDRFGNVRLSVRDGERFLAQLGDLQYGDEVHIFVGKNEVMSAIYTDALADIPVGKTGLYQNVADISRTHRRAKYWELVKRSDHCLTDKEMAIDLLKKGNASSWGMPIRVEKK